MEGFLGRVVINAVALFIISFFGWGLKIDNLVTTLIAAVVLGLLNAIVRPVLGFLSLPITILTLGLFALVLNAFMFWLMSRLVPGIQTSNWILRLAGLQHHHLAHLADRTVDLDMKSHRKELWFNVPGRRGFINITPQVEAAAARERRP